MHKQYFVYAYNTKLPYNVYYGQSRNVFKFEIKINSTNTHLDI